MSSLSRRLCTHALAVMALSLPATVEAQQSDADVKAVSATALTMPKYKQYLDATVNLANVAAKNPGLAEGMKDGGEKSINEQVKMLESNPQVKAAVTSTGLSTRDYVLTQWALLQTGMAYTMTKGTGASQDDMIKKAGVSKANMDFYAQNEAEINKLAEEAKARTPAMPDDEDAGDDSGEE
jgi:hypothetical protein